MGITLVPGSVATAGPRVSCTFHIPPQPVQRILNTALTRKGIAVDGFRRGRVPAPVALARYRVVAESALCSAVRQAASKLQPRLREATVPAEFTAGGLREDGSYLVHAHWLETRQPPQPWQGLAAAAGVAPYAAPALPPLAGGLAVQQLLPDSVSRAPQLQHFRLGGLQPPQHQAGGAPAVPTAGQVRLPVLPQTPGQAPGKGGHQAPAAPTPTVALPDEAAPAAGGAR